MVIKILWREFYALLCTWHLRPLNGRVLAYFRREASHFVAERHPFRCLIVGLRLDASRLDSLARISVKFLGAYDSGSCRAATADRWRVSVDSLAVIIDGLVEWDVLGHVRRVHVVRRAALRWNWSEAGICKGVVFNANNLISRQLQHSVHLLIVIHQTFPWVVKTTFSN